MCFNLHSAITFAPSKFYMTAWGEFLKCTSNYKGSRPSLDITTFEGRARADLGYTVSSNKTDVVNKMFKAVPSEYTEALEHFFTESKAFKDNYYAFEGYASRTIAVIEVRNLRRELESNILFANL